MNSDQTYSANDIAVIAKYHHLIQHNHSSQQRTLASGQLLEIIVL
jgi:hypothetical protein